MLVDRRYCYPLTVTDHAWRNLLLCEAMESNAEEIAFTAFGRLWAANYRIGPNSEGFGSFDRIAWVRDIVIVFVHLIVTLVRLARPGGLRSVVAESVLVKHQLRILNRGQKRAPNLLAADRIIAGLCTLFIPARVPRSAIVLKPSTLLHLHHVMTKRKYRSLFSSGRKHRPGPKGPDKEMIDAVVEMKRRNPSWGCPRIAQQITLTFGV